MESKNNALLIVFSGPSGVGKGTIKADYIEKYGKNVYFSVSATTRSPREGEKDGVDYLFVSEEKFRRMIDNNEFYEWAFVHGKYYGTPKKPAFDAIASGKDVIFDIDVQGGLQIKKQSPEAVMIFIAPPSMEVLEKRLRGRGTETEEQIQKRLSNASGEMEHQKDYDYIVVNCDIAESTERVRQIIENERSHI